MSVENGAAKLQNKLSIMIQKYQAVSGAIPQRWAQGMTQKAGVTPGPSRMAAMQAGMQGAEQRYAEGVRRGVAYWAQRYREAMSI